jgi:diguanylate cyclase (GGDEF)-like protein
MISPHTVLVVTLVSQSTSTAVLFLLALSDRRFRGLTQMAFACAIHTAAIALLPLWRGRGLWLPEAFSAALLPLMCLLICEALRAFLRQGGRSGRPVRAGVGATMALVFALAPITQLWSMQIARTVACALLSWTVLVLWRGASGAVQIPARITAGLLFFILATFLLRLPLEPHVPATPFLLTLRELTMCGFTLLGLCAIAIYLAQSKVQVHQETRLDALTGLPNRRALEERAAGQVRLAQRHGFPLALLMMDLDAFKVLNDTWGHAVGDRALHAVGDVLLGAARSTGNTVARLGGEEFAMLLPEISLAGAQRIAEHLRIAIAELIVLEGTRPVPLTISIGVAVLQPGEATWSEMLRRADAALYRAKREGRNRVAVCLDALHTLPTSALPRVSPAPVDPEPVCAVVD